MNIFSNFALVEFYTKLIHIMWGPGVYEFVQSYVCNQIKNETEPRRQEKSDLTKACMCYTCTD